MQFLGKHRMVAFVLHSNANATATVKYFGPSLGVLLAYDMRYIPYVKPTHIYIYCYGM